MVRLKLAFMGTPVFARAALEALTEAVHEIAAVYSQPPRASGRGLKPRPSPVQAVADSKGFAVHTPTSLREPAEQAAFAGLDVDVAVVAAYGLILPPAILQAPRLGCLNIHASLLPRWRGAAPIQRAILAGDNETGITIMQMDKGLDTGAMLLSESTPIAPGDTAGTLHDRLAAMGATLIVTALDRLSAGALQPTPQPADGVSYATKLVREEEQLDWRKSAQELGRQIRALSPRPAAWCEMAGERIKVLAAEPIDASGPPGRMLDERLAIACGSGALRLQIVQRAGKSPMPAADFLRGFHLVMGTVLP